MRTAALVAVLLALTMPDLRRQTRAPSRDWPVYGGDSGGSRFSALAAITPRNAAALEIAWTYHTGETAVTITRGSPPAFEATPLVIDGTMYFPTPLGRVVALDAATGRARWRYDALVDPARGYSDFTSRGVSYWRDTRLIATATCARRIFFAAVDGRLLALDAATGRPCQGFGDGGQIDLRRGLRIQPFEPQAYEVTSPPAIVGDLVITGSGIADNDTTAPASGEVRAFDARTGALRWTFDPILDSPEDGWRNNSRSRTGGANVWSVIVADVERDLIFLPTSSPAPDHYGGERLGDNRYANSLVALRASTGKVVWQFQTVHHDLWDFDNASPPALATVTRTGRRIAAVLQATKTGMLFVLDRDTGRPVFPVEERPVPRSDVPGEAAWPTQPFTLLTPPLVPQRYSPEDAWGPTEADRAWCRAALTQLRNDGVFTPPSLQGTFAIPSTIGGAHWGGVGVDPLRGLAVVPVNRIATMIQLARTEGLDAAAVRRRDAALWPNASYEPMRGTPFSKRRRFFLGPSGMPCTPPPFGALVAVNLTTGAIAWNVPLGKMSTAAGAPAGAANLGGPLLLGSGVTFVAATIDRAIRAFDSASGQELWQATLPAGGRAAPMTYEAGGRQFIVIAAGGGDEFGAGDSLVAFALPVTSK